MLLSLYSAFNSIIFQSAARVCAIYRSPCIKSRQYYLNVKTDEMVAMMPEEAVITLLRCFKHRCCKRKSFFLKQ